MAAVIAIGALTLAADGVTLTGTLSGGTGTGYAITSAAGIQPHVSTAGGDRIFPTATPVISAGTTITITLPTPYLSGQTVQLDVTASNTITDSGANTGATATNTAVTNNSTQTASVTNFLANLGLFNFNGAMAQFGSGLAGSSMAPPATSANVAYPCEAVVNVTSGTVSIDMNAVYGSAKTLVWQVDGGAQQSYTTLSSGSNEVCRLASNLAVGKHVIRFGLMNSSWLTSLRMVTTSGAGAYVTVPCPVAIFKDSVASLLNVANAVSPVKRWGTMKYSTNTIINSHPGFQFLLKGVFQGASLQAYNGNGAGVSFGVVADYGSTPVPLDQYTTTVVGDPGVTLRNAWSTMPLVQGALSAAVSHTVEYIDIGQNQYQAVMVWNGSTLSAAALAGAATISVADITNIADGDWLCLDYQQNEEMVKVASHSGSGPYTLALASVLAKAHASGVAARNLTPASTPTITTATAPVFVGRLMFIGDSLTHAESISTGGVAPDPVSYGNGQTYDPRVSYAMMAGRAAGWDIIPAATQGWTTANMVADNAATNYDQTPPCTAYVVLAGTNDYRTNVALATFQANITSLINQFKAVAPSGTRILLLKIFSPTNIAVNGNGATKADFNNAMQTAIAAAAAAGYTFSLIDIATLAGLNLTVGSADVPDSLHPSITTGLLTGTGGQNKMAAALYPILLGLAAKGFFGLV